EPLCRPLVELLLARKIIAVPANPGQPRIPQGPDVGYASVSRIDRISEHVPHAVRLTNRHPEDPFP
ncbi:MAG TPA: hypothetical protein VMS31_03280, partial [Pyrinomonadaceae bacterium]|nr:hypothetical protein [Pyrinomonadaceae bacterium]